MRVLSNPPVEAMLLHTLAVVRTYVPRQQVFVWQAVLVHYHLMRLRVVSGVLSVSQC